MRGRTTRVFGIEHQSLAELLERLATIEPHLAPPVSVRIHGDFNTNNIVWGEERDRVHLIDVHRSGDGDYVQDIGVLLVSNVRNPIQDARIVGDLEAINRRVEQFAGEFARLTGDEHFDVRLTLARARSLITSGRLITDLAFARSLYLEGVRQLERAAGMAA